MSFQTALTRTLGLSLLIFVNYLGALAQPDSIYRLAAGTHIKLKLDAEISSRFAGVNDTFLATVSQPVRVRNTIVLPTGTEIEGRVTGVTPASAPRKSGRLDLLFEMLKISNSESRGIDGILANELRPKRDVISYLSILGGAAGGALIGGLARSGTGTLVGAGVGAGIGAAIALGRKGKDVGIEKDAEFEIVLRKEVVLPVMDY